MPAIPEYDAGNLSIRPSETGVEAQAGTARRVGMFFNQGAAAEETLARETERLANQTQQLGRQTGQLGSEKQAAMTSVGRAIGSGVEAAGDVAVKALDHEQISKGSADFTKLMLDKTQQWNDLVKNADPNDRTVAPKFMAGLEQDLQDFKENGGFITENGQKWAEAHTDALRQHLAEKTQGDMATLAGEAVVVNHRQTINQLSATVHDDPSSIDFALAALKSSAEGVISTSPNLTGTAAAKVRTELNQTGSEAIVKSAAIGYIEKTGKMPAWISDPKYSPYVNATELQMFEKQAKAQAKVDALTAKQTDLVNRQINERKAEAAANQIMQDHIKLDPQTGRPLIGPDYFKAAMDIARMPDVKPGLVRTMIDWGEKQQDVKSEPIRDDPTTRQQLTDRLFDPNNPTTRVDLMRAQVDGKLSDHSFQSMERLVTELEQSPLKGPAWQATTTAVKDRLIRSDLPEGKDAVGAANYATFINEFVPQYLAKARAGTLPPNALNLNDPNSMISQALQPYRASMQDRLKAAFPEPDKPAAAANETPAALRDIASLSFSKSRNLYRDDTSGKLYRPDGTEVK